MTGWGNLLEFLHVARHMESSQRLFSAFPPLLSTFFALTSYPGLPADYENNASNSLNLSQPRAYLFGIPCSVDSSHNLPPPPGSSAALLF